MPPDQLVAGTDGARATEKAGTKLNYKDGSVCERAAVGIASRTSHRSVFWSFKPINITATVEEDL